MSAPQTSDTANITRVCVKNLPVELSVDQLRAIFAARGEVTDAKIMKTESGRSRKFGFVGFRTPDNAATAVSHFNKTFIQSNRIAVEFAVPQGDDNLNRAWSKYSHGSSQHKSRNPELYSKVAKTTTEMSSGEQKQTSIKEKEPKKMSILTTLKEKAESLENDPRFADFLGVMGAGKKTEFWANDTNSAVHLASLKEPDQSSKLKKGEAASKTISPAQPERISSQPPKSKKQVSEPTTTIETLEPAMSKAPKLSENEAVSDMDFLKSLMVSENDPSFLDSAPEPAAKVEPVDDPDSPKTWNEITAVEGEANFDAGRLFVRNLSFAVKEEELIELFAPFGSLSQVHIPIDSTKRGKGFAYLTYTLPENAIKACAGLDRKTFQGRLLHVLPAKEQKVVTSAEANIKKAGSSFKRQQAEKLARTSQNDSNWNTMFLRSATVADAIAQRLGVNKESVLDKHSDASLAVRMALAETQLLQETKEFLEDEGIRLQALAQTDVKDAKVKVCRSKTVILVKNIPFQTEPDEVRRLFAPHGELRRVVLPPTKTICVIEFLEPNEAKKAFRSLAYKKFKTVPLFLEWAPDKMFMSAEEKAQVLEARKQEKAATGTVESKNDDDIPSSTLCIKNLNFDTTEESVRYMFSRIGPITSVKIMQKPNPKKVDQVSKPMLSMGYGFVQFDDPAHALSALQRLQGSELDGHQLVLSKAKRGSVAAEERGKSKRKTTTTNSDILSTTKLLIRNVAFQTTLKEIRELVVPFGKLKQCRLPTKFDGRPRGFAFAEYFSEQEAKQAFEALQHTHLYGRHLVVEWAKEDDDVAQLRAKTVSKFQSGELAAQGIVVAKTGANKRRKVEQLDDADTSFLKQMGSI